MSLPKMSTFAAGYEMPSATFEIRLCATVWPPVMFSSTPSPSRLPVVYGVSPTMMLSATYQFLPPSVMKIAWWLLVKVQRLTTTSSGLPAVVRPCDWFLTVMPSSHTWLPDTVTPSSSASPSPNAFHAM